VTVTVRIPTVLRPATDGQRAVAVDGETVGDVLVRLAADHPGVREQVFTSEGTLHRFLNVYVNDDDVRYTGGLSTAVASGDEVTLLPAVAGGAR
jgi:molybdopterin converting factor small subunit